MLSLAFCSFLNKLLAQSHMPLYRAIEQQDNLNLLGCDSVSNEQKIKMAAKYKEDVELNELLNPIKKEISNVVNNLEVTNDFE